METGDKYDHLYENGSLADISEAFAARVPDLAALDYETEAQFLTLKNGEPVYFEVEGSYRSADVPTLSWSVNAERDYENRRRGGEKLEDLTYDRVAEIRSREQNIYFTWDGHIVAVYIAGAGTAEMNDPRFSNIFIEKRGVVLRVSFLYMGVSCICLFMRVWGKMPKYKRNIFTL